MDIMNKILNTGLFLTTLVSLPVEAGIIFSFDEIGGDVVMTASGTLDTTKLVSATSRSWGSFGIEDLGSIDIMGDTFSGGLDTGFGFSAGTDLSAWASSSGPFFQNNFEASHTAGTTSFATYISPFTSGIGLASADIIGGLWTPDNIWTFSGATFASVGLSAGTFTISDALTNESISIKVGASAVPVPAAVWLFGTGLVGLIGMKKRHQTFPVQSA